MHRSTTPIVHQQVFSMVNASLNQFKRPVIIYSDLVSTLELGHPTHPSILGLKAHRREAPDVGSEPRSEPAHLDIAKPAVIHDSLSVIAEQIRATAVGDDGGAQGRLHMFRDPMLGCNKKSQGMNDSHPQQKQCCGPSSIASSAISNGQAFPRGGVVDAALVAAEAGTDKDPAASKLEQPMGPRRHYQRLGIRGETSGADAERFDGTQPNKGSISKQVNIAWGRPEESSSGAREFIDRADKFGGLQDSAVRILPHGLDILLHVTRSMPAPGSFMAGEGNPMAVIDILLASMDEAEPAAMNTLTAAIDEELATIGALVAAMDDEMPTALFSLTEDESLPMEAYWRASPLPSSAARQHRMNEFPEGIIQRLKPSGGTIYFDMDMSSFTRAKVDADIKDSIKDSAIKAAEEFTEQGLGIAFAYTTDPRRKVFSIRYDPGLDPKVIANAFFPCDSPDRWHVRVSSVADDPRVFEDNHKFMHKVFYHEFAHILGLRHHDAGSNHEELGEPSTLWLGTRDGDSKTIMRTGVPSSELKLYNEDLRVIRDFYSKENGAVLGDVRILDVDPYKRRWDFFLYQYDLLNGLDRLRRRARE